MERQTERERERQTDRQTDGQGEGVGEQTRIIKFIYIYNKPVKFLNFKRKKLSRSGELTIRTLGLEGQLILQGRADAHLVLSQDAEEVSHILQETFHCGGCLVSRHFAHTHPLGLADI